MPGLVVSTSPKAVGRHESNTLRLNSTDTPFNRLNALLKEFAVVPKEQERKESPNCTPCDSNVSNTKIVLAEDLLEQTTAEADNDTLSSRASVFLSLPPELQAMYMAAAAMYPFYTQQGNNAPTMPTAAVPTAAVYPGYMMGYPGFQPFNPMMQMYGQLAGFDGAVPAQTMSVPPTFPPQRFMPVIPPDYATAAYYQNLADLQALQISHGRGPVAMPTPRAALPVITNVSDASDDDLRDVRPGEGAGAARKSFGTGSEHIPLSRDKDRARKSEKGPRGVRRDDHQEDVPQLPLLEELRATKTKKHDFEMKEIPAGEVVRCSLDQFGSRLIQQKIETLTQDELDSMFRELEPQLGKLMIDVFGNYVVQKFLEYGSARQRSVMMAAVKGHVLSLSLQMYGCRVIQKCMEVLGPAHQGALVFELEAHVLKCVHDQNGNHVIQKVIECAPVEFLSRVLDVVCSSIYTLSTHPFGCRVVQRVLERITEEKSEPRGTLLREVVARAVDLSCDQYGNYVVQHVLEHGSPAERSRVVARLAPVSVRLAQHKFASNVVEKCLLYGVAADRRLLMSHMLRGSDVDGAGGPAVAEGSVGEPLTSMMKDQFGNYVVQKLLEVCEPGQREALLGLVRSHLSSLKKFTYGKHIVARVEKLLSAGARIQQQANAAAAAAAAAGSPVGGSSSATATTIPASAAVPLAAATADAAA